DEEVKFIATVRGAAEAMPDRFNAAYMDKERKRGKRWRKKRVDHIKRVARAIGVESPVDKSTVGFAEIVREAASWDGVPARNGEIVWKQLSGLAHPSLTRAVQAHRHEAVDESPDDNATTQFSTNIGTARLAVDLL